jgi:hypothetical protein
VNGIAFARHSVSMFAAPDGVAVHAMTRLELLAARICIANTETPAAAGIRAGTLAPLAAFQAHQRKDA